MITKIFYSLVLFWIINYNENNSLWFFLLKISEISFWKVELIFKNISWQTETIIFTHKNFISENTIWLQTKNWQITGNNKELLDLVYSSISVSDTKDFPFFENTQHYRDIAFGVVLTITSKCNIFCYYCFNDIDYEIKERNTRDNFWLDYWKNIVDHLYDNGTRVVILTGGEPMVAPFFWELLDYLKEKNIFVHVNTNGTVLWDSILEKLNKNYSINLMVSIHEFNDRDYYEVNKKWLDMSFGITKIPERFNKLFTTKLEQLRKIKNYPNISLEFLTILVWKNILNLDKIYEFWYNCWVDFHSWQFFRLYSTKNNTWATKSMMELAINRMYLLNKKYWVDNKIVDPVPFCVTKNTERARSVIDGVLSDSHDVKTIITTRWDVQMMSAYDNNFWNIAETPITDIFKTDFVKKQLNNGFLPKECSDCKYKEECRWWSRMDAHIVNGDYGAFDPIWDINNKVI
jgi:radical SAM protein with 4Fe4S-binding SPASM domain